MKKIQKMMPLLLAVTLSFIGMHYFMSLYGRAIIGSSKRGILFLIWIGAIFLPLTIYLHTFVHELGHLVFGLCTGYRFLLFQIKDYVLIKKNGKFLLKKFSLPGILGQCLLSPPPLVDGKLPFFLYNSGGLIFTFLLTVSAWLLMNRSEGYWLYFEIITVVFGIYLFLVNIIPAKNLGVNDGNNLLELIKDERNQEIFHRMLTIHEQQLNGYFLRDMPDEWFKKPDEELFRYQLPITLYHMIISRQMEKQLFETACGELEQFLGSHTIHPIMALLMKADWLYLLLVLKKKETVDSLCDDQFLKELNGMQNMPSVSRSLYALYRLHQQDEAKAKEALKVFENTVARFTYEKEVDFNRELIAYADRLSQEEAV